ncbi:hypothetical protein CDV31_013530, partial [Fusarium ambrosium]
MYEGGAGTQPPPTVPEPGQAMKLNWRVWPVTFAFMLSWCGWQSCFTLLSPILTHVNADIGPHPNYSWMVASISVCIAVVWPIAGSLSDIFGRRYFFLAGLSCGIIGSIVACTAQSVPVVIAGTTIIGLGTAIQQMVIAAISEIFPNKYRGYAQASITLASTPMSGLGPLISPLIVQSRSWRWVFYITIIIDFAAFILLAIFYHPPVPNRDRSRRSLLGQIDFAGLGLFAVGLTAFLVGISWAGGQYSWSSAAVLVPLIGGASILVACGCWEVYGAVNPIFPPHLFREYRGFTNVLLICFVASMPLLALLSFWPTQIASMYPASPRQIGIWTIPLTCGTLCGGILVGTIKWWRPTNYYMVGCTGVLTIFAGLLSTIDIDDVRPALAYSFLYGVGVGLLELAVIVTIQFSIGPESIGKVTGLLSSSRGVAGACGIAIYASILETRLAEDLPTRVAAAAIPLGLPSSSLPALLEAAFAGNYDTAGQIPGVTPTILDATFLSRRESFQYSLRPIHYLGTALGGLAVILAYFTNDISPKMDDQVAVDLK